MKTIMTSLPIYDKIEKQCFERGKKGGVDKPVPIICPRHRLPSFQWLDNGDGCDHIDKIELIERDLTTTDITTYFTALPSSHVITGDKYFVYEGDTLKYLLTAGIYYLKITMDNDYIYYSDWFQVDCVYENLITSFENNSYETFTSTGTTITSAIETGASGLAYSSLSGRFPLDNETPVHIVFYFTKNSGQLPVLGLYSVIVSANVATYNVVEGLNDIVLYSTIADDEYNINFVNTAAANWSTSEVLVFKDYSDKYLILNFSNTCDIGDLLYHDGFTQTLWFVSEPMEATFPIDDKGVEDGEGRFIRTFARQVKKYSIKTKEMPAFMVDVFHRMRLHDDVELTDLVGDTNEVYNLEVEHEWLWDDKYYAQITLTFDYNEVFVVAGCCNNLT